MDIFQKDFVNSVLRFIEKIEITRRKRDFKGFWDIFFKILSASFSFFLIATALSDLIPSSVVRGGFICFVLVMAFLLYPWGKNSPLHRPSAVDFVAIALALGACGNFSLFYESEMVWRVGTPTFGDIFWGIITIVLVLEACRRAMSFMLPIVALVFLLYSYFGFLLPGILSHSGFSVSLVVADMYASLNGIFGMIAYVFAAYVALFVIMGAFFDGIGAEGFFMDLPVALSSKMRGGPAKAVVFSSTLFGMISGSSVANTVATGTFTIPLMKKAGYKPEVAGAIEPAVDVGGMFMPPVMGAGAFLMAEMMRIPYAQVAMAALVPALIYFFSTLVMVHFEALKTGIGIVPKEERAPALPIFLKNWYYAIPLVILFYLILAGRSPSMAAFYAIISATAICFIKNLINRNPRKTIFQVFDGLVKGGESSLSISAAVGPVGIIVGIALLTGVAFKFSALVLTYTYGLKWMALLMVMVATFVLGMGITVTADYLMLAIMAVPAMAEMGIAPIAAHFVCFWYSQSSNITPPVCMSVFAGAAIAGTHPYKTAIPALRFSAYMYVMPFMFVYSNILMIKGFSFDVLLTWVTGFFSCIPFAAGMTGYFFGDLSWWQRITLIISSILLIFPGPYFDGIGLALMALVGIPQYLREKRLNSGMNATQIS